MASSYVSLVKGVREKGYFVTPEVNKGAHLSILLQGLGNLPHRT